MAISSPTVTPLEHSNTMTISSTRDVESGAKSKQLGSFAVRWKKSAHLELSFFIFGVSVDMPVAKRHVSKAEKVVFLSPCPVLPTVYRMWDDQTPRLAKTPLKHCKQPALLTSRHTGPGAERRCGGRHSCLTARRSQIRFRLLTLRSTPPGCSSAFALRRSGWAAPGLNAGLAETENEWEDSNQSLQHDSEANNVLNIPLNATTNCKLIATNYKLITTNYKLIWISFHD